MIQHEIKFKKKNINRFLYFSTSEQVFQILNCLRFIFKRRLLLRGMF